MKPGLSRHCLLVIDDEPDMVQSVMDLLRFDYRVFGTCRVDEAERIMAREEVHLVMTDQRMPGMSGVEFLKRVKEAHPDTVRLLFTAYTDIETVVDAINQGNVYRYITKPWEPAELKAILKQASDYFDLQAERKRLTTEVQEKNRQLQAANEELRRANEVKNVFIRVASHELRTPLTVILGLAELGAQLKLSQPGVQFYLEQIRSSGRRLSGRIDQMVQLLLSERFERPLQRHAVDLTRLLREAAATVASFVERRRQTLKIDAGDDLGTALLDEEKMHDCLVQLLLNAIKFTPDGGTIELSGKRAEPGGIITSPQREQGLIIRVRDHGTGISAENLPYIFDPFFTRFDLWHHSSGTYEFDRRGLGLGLTVVKAFVEMHGGRVQVESEQGKGSTFTLSLPAGDCG